MKKVSKVFLLILAVFLMAFSLVGCQYNNIVEQREKVESQWANVENQYQRRADLIPNLVSTVKGYAAHEESVFKEVTEARSALGGQIVIDSSITDDPEKFAEFQKVQNELGSSLQRLMAVSEAYPELKANENFKDLQSQLEGTENRISTERKRYNDAVQTYNSTITKFPGVISAKIFGFTKKAYFQADPSTYKAPTVSF